MSVLRTRADVIRYWWEQAETCLGSARREAAAEALPYAVNRIYYAAFYAASALLLSRGKSFRKHSGVRAAVQRDLVATGQLAPELGKLYDRLFLERHQADYVALVSFETQHVAEMIDRCTEFVASLKKLAGVGDGPAK